MYLARYAPGAPTPWVLSRPLHELELMVRAVGEIVELEMKKDG